MIRRSTGLPMRPAGRAIVLKDGCLLVMKRTKPGGFQYMVTPGGRVEPGEKPEETVIREVAEETTVVISNPHLVFVEEPNDGVWGTQYIYLCDYVSGDARLNPESEEYYYQQKGHGTFDPLWIPINEFPDIEYPFLSVRLGKEIKKALTTGFPASPKHWTIDGV